jgi:hypothetical protein
VMPSWRNAPEIVCVLLVLFQVCPLAIPEYWTSSSSQHLTMDYIPLAATFVGNFKNIVKEQITWVQ